MQGIRKVGGQAQLPLRTWSGHFSEVKESRFNL